jgi:MFS family permease
LLNKQINPTKLQRSRVHPESILKKPSLRLLQGMNALVGFSQYLMMALSLTRLKAAGWTAWQIGLAMFAANLAYGGLVSFGGRLAEHWGRAKTSMAGAAFGCASVILALAWDVPTAAFAATLGCFAGASFFYPGCAGLFSDFEPSSGAGQEPLHRKISGYNLGWSSGNLAGFALYGLIASWDVRLALLFPAAGFALASVLMAPWRHLPPLPPKAEGDRSHHPALDFLIFMGRANLFIVSIGTMSMLALVEKALGPLADPLAARRLAGFTAAVYALGYVSMFGLLGRWRGWILKPWILWACQAGLVLGSASLIFLGLQPSSLGFLPLAGLLLGFGYGAAYTGSLYYSLRLPEGSSRAAGMHETFLGIGNTLGPLLGGLFLTIWAGFSTASLAGLGIFILCIGGLALGFQAVRIPALAGKLDS